MDLAISPRKVTIAMEHATKEGGTKILRKQPSMSVAAFIYI